MILLSKLLSAYLISLFFFWISPHMSLTWACQRTQIANITQHWHTQQCELHWLWRQFDWERAKPYRFNITFVPCKLRSYSNLLNIGFSLISVYFSSAVSPQLWKWLFRENWWGHLETWATRISVWFLLHVLIDANYMVYFIISVSVVCQRRKC